MSSFWQPWEVGRVWGIRTCPAPFARVWLRRVRRSCRAGQALVKEAAQLALQQPWLGSMAPHE